MSCHYLGECDAIPGQKIPLFLDRISCGFPSPAADFCERSLDLNELCIKNPAATFFVRAEGYSMVGAGINPGDVLVVDRSIDAKHGHIVVAAYMGELTCKRLQTKPTLCLLPENSRFRPIEILDGSDLQIFGVVTNIVRRVVL